MIEIELAKDGKRFQENIVITCTIKREGNKTSFSVNGKPQGKKVVVELCKSLAIQIDNLCQFLPQDKVVEFAAMTPVELLRSTQRAVASQEMIDMHEELKDLRRKQKDAQARFDSDQEQLTNLENRQRLQEADVERMREREQIEKRVKMLEIARPFAAYRSVRTTVVEAKERRKEALNELTRLEQEVGPTLRASNAKEHYMKQLETVMRERKGAIGKAERHADGIDRKFKDLNDESNDLVAEHNAEKNGGKKHRQEVARLELIIERLKKQVEEQPAEVDVQVYNTRIREQRTAIETNHKKTKDLQEEQRRLTQRGREKNLRIEQAQQNMAELDSQAGRQNLKLQRASRDTYELWTWLQQHQDEFEKPIFGPPLVECSVKDLKYVDQIEALFQQNVMLSFTAQTNNDYKKLSSQAHDIMRLSEVNIKTQVDGLEPFPVPQIGVDQMRSYGFDGWAIEYLSGPEHVLAMLCYEVKIHQTGVSLQDTSTHQYELLQNSNIMAWVTSKSLYRIIRRREYGSGATFTQVKPVGRARVWTEQPVDFTAKLELQESIQGWTEEVASFKAEHEAIQSRLSTYREAMRNADEQQVGPLHGLDLVI